MGRYNKIEPSVKYTLGELAERMYGGIHRNTLINWMQVGLKVDGKTIELNYSYGRGGMYLIKGCDLISFLDDTKRTFYLEG